MSSIRSGAQFFNLRRERMHGCQKRHFLAAFELKIIITLEFLLLARYVPNVAKEEYQCKKYEY